MKLTPFQLGMLALTGFASVVMLSILAKYQSNDEFRESLANLKPSDLVSIRARRVAEEQMQPVAIVPDLDADDNVDDGDSNVEA